MTHEFQKFMSAFFDLMNGSIVHILIFLVILSFHLGVSATDKEVGGRPQTLVMLLSNGS